MNGKTKALLSAGCAAVSGAINGMLGAGGGILLVVALDIIYGGENDSFKKAVSGTLAVTLCMSVAAAVIYLVKGNVKLSDAYIYLIPSALGGIAGAKILEKINAKWLCRIFSVLVVFAGARMIF